MSDWGDHDDDDCFVDSGDDDDGVHRLSNMFFEAKHKGISGWGGCPIVVMDLLAIALQGDSPTHTHTTMMRGMLQGDGLSETGHSGHPV